MTDLVTRLRAQFDEDERLINEYEVWMSARAVAAGTYVLVRPPGWGSGEPFDIDRMLRRVAADRCVLARHVPRLCRDCPENRGHNLCAACGTAVNWPCADICDLADGLGVDLEVE